MHQIKQVYDLRHQFDSVILARAPSHFSEDAIRVVERDACITGCGVNG
jgi:hypothetical protein